MNNQYGTTFRKRLKKVGILPLIGIYDLMSASIAAKHFEAIFCSGYGFSASQYGLPDEGFITWTDMVHYVERVRTILPDIHIVVDIDDGYGDPNIASTVVRKLERVGASAVILEDQKRPKKCGHLPGKELLEINTYLNRLNAVLDSRDSLYVIARTDSPNIEEGIARANHYAEVGADAIMIEGLTDISQIPHIRESVPENVSITVNLIAGGKTPPVTLEELRRLKVNLVVYSTPCLFAAHAAIDDTLKEMISSDLIIPDSRNRMSLQESNELLSENLKSSML